jgi:uncharacterized SAM-binding protein YcdF (DUF218 family)
MGLREPGLQPAATLASMMPQTATAFARPLVQAPSHPPLSSPRSSMNAFFVDFGLTDWKPLLTTLLLPPMPLLGLALAGGLCALRRSRAQRPARGALALTALSLAGIWLATCTAVGEALEARLPGLPPVLVAADFERLQAQVRKRPLSVAVVVLGGGLEPLAPEYGQANLSPWSAERLRYGLWLARRTGAPVGFSGGVGWGQHGPAASEAAVAAHIAERDFGQSLRWVESASRDTRENAGLSVPLLLQAGVEEVLLVSHIWHLPRARRAFEQAAAGRLRITPAPMGAAVSTLRPVLRWLPSGEGMVRTRQVMREWLGLWFSA